MTARQRSYRLAYLRECFIMNLDGTSRENVRRGFVGVVQDPKDGSCTLQERKVCYEAS